MLSQMLADYAAANESGKQDMFEEAAERMITAEKGLRYASGKLEAQASRLQAIEAAARELVDDAWVLDQHEDDGGTPSCLWCDIPKEDAAIEGHFHNCKIGKLASALAQPERGEGEKG
jgi:hypothetical protein